MYSIESLIKTCNSAGYEAETYAPYNEDEYILQLQNLIDKNLAPMVFFDLDLTPMDRYGFPRIGDGENEHAAVVVGYYKNEYDETRFVVNHWGEYFDFDGMEPALSACHSLVEKRKVETFCKVMTAHGEKAWVLKTKAHQFGIPLEDVAEQTALPMQDTHTPLKGKILVVTEPQPARDRFFPSLTEIGEGAVKKTTKDSVQAGQGALPML